MRSIFVFLITTAGFFMHAQNSWPWVLSTDTSNYSLSEVTEMTYDPAGNILLTGAYSNSVAIGGFTLQKPAGNGCYLASVKKNGTINWISTALGSHDIRVTGLCTDQAGNSYVAGYFTNTLTIGSAVLTQSPAPARAIFIFKYNAAGALLWAKKVGHGMTFPGAIRNTGGLLYMNGVFTTMPNVPVFSLGGQSFTVTPGGPGNAHDCFLAQLDTSGNVSWVSQYGGTDNEFMEGLAINGNGDVIMTGGFKSASITFGTYTLSGPSTQNTSAFLVKINSSAVVQWAKSFHDMPGSTRKITIGPAGNIVLTGSFRQPGFKIDHISVASAAGANGLVASFDQQGTVQWVKVIQDVGINGGNFASALDQFGNLFVTGSYSTPSITIGSHVLTNQGNLQQLYLVHYDPAGNVAGVSEAGGPGGAVLGLCVLADNAGKVHVGGMLDGSVLSFGSTSLAGRALMNVYWRMFVAEAGSIFTGIDKRDMHADFEVFPNPSSDHITIESDAEIAGVQLHDLTGKVIAQFNPHKNTFTADISGVAKGLYFVRITTVDDRTAVRKFIRSE